MTRVITAAVSGTLAFVAVNLWLKPFVRAAGWANWDENADALGELFQHPVLGLLLGASATGAINAWGRDILLPYLAVWLAVPTAICVVLLVMGGRWAEAVEAGFAPLTAVAVIGAVVHWALMKIFVIVRDA